MKIKPYVENFLAPEYKGNGLDIYLQEDVTLNPSEPTKIKLGFATEIPSGHIAMLVPRSSAGAIHGIHLRNTVGVSVLSFSLSSFDDDTNAEIVQMPPALKVNIIETCAIAKEYDFTLRLSLNMNKYLLESLGFKTNKKIDYEKLNDKIFEKAIELGADQLTFRKLYTSGDNPQTDWINENKVDDEFL